MSDMLIDRSRLPDPTERPAGYQRWSNLAFLHWRVPIDVLRPLIPEPLSIDTWEGEAWLGIVAFTMSRVRPSWAPPLPYLSAFPETNLRTYVHLHGAQPGVWFFSLDASRWLAVQVARLGWRLNYCWSRMRVAGSYAGCTANAATQIVYQSRRWRSGACPIDMRLSIAAGQTVRTAEPGLLEHFLCERYLLYTRSPRGQLLRARVHHPPYPLLDAELVACEQSLTDSIGCQMGQPEHVVFSPGVNVSVYPLQRVSTAETRRKTKLRRFLAPSGLRNVAPTEHEVQ